MLKRPHAAEAMRYGAAPLPPQSRCGAALLSLPRFVDAPLTGL